VQLALTRHGFSLADIRGLTPPEVRTYIDLLAETASGKPAQGKQYVNQRMKRRR
jgi:hypothetical protein